MENITSKAPCIISKYLLLAVWNRADHYIFALWFLLYGRPM